MRFALLLGAVCAVAFPTISSAAESGPVSAPTMKLGDTWVFDRTFERGVNGFSERRVDLKVERLSEQNMLVGIKLDGSPNNYEDHIIGMDWSQLREKDGKETVTGRPFSFPMSVGNTWSADFINPVVHGRQTSAHNHLNYKVVGWEDVTVPAGTFHALKIEVNGTIDADMSAGMVALNGVSADKGGVNSVSHSELSPAHVEHIIDYEELFYVPEVRYFVKSLEEHYNSENVRVSRDTGVLISFKAGE